jgi:hypothetical protein
VGDDVAPVKARIGYKTDVKSESCGWLLDSPDPTTGIESITIA